MSDTSERKQSVALVSMVASAGLALAKLIVGLMSGSLAILSEALHSLIDLGATVMTYLAVRVSDKPADERHHFGHGKVEAVTALIETGLLVVVSLWVMQEAVRRLFGEPHGVDLTVWAFAVLIGSIVIDFWRARALNKAAKETRSQALEADALHFTSDMWSSAIVLVGLCAVWLGFPQGDAVAAIIVAMFILAAAWGLGRRTIDVLVDAAPEGATERITDAALGVRDVVLVDQVRVRPAGAALFADVFVRVPRGLSLERAVAVKAAVADAVIAAMPEADVSVTANPIAIDDETARERVAVIAHNRRLAVHHVTTQNLGDRLSVSLDLEVDGGMPLAEAHRVASELEQAIRGDFGPDTEVETHIEPLDDTALDGQDVPEAVRARLADSIATLVPPDSGLSDAHNVRARETARGLFVTLHCRAAPGARVDHVHAAVDALEQRIKSAWPEVARVVTHAEPERVAGRLSPRDRADDI